jgi:hypothetical protein
LVHQALADDDPASLLSPLADTHAHLTATHAGLAAQVRSLTDQATQVRHTTHVLRSGLPPAAEHRTDTPAHHPTPKQPAGDTPGASPTINQSQHHRP